MDCEAGTSCSRSFGSGYACGDKKAPNMLQRFLRKCTTLCPTHQITTETQKKIINEMKSLDFSKCSFHLPKRTLPVPTYSSDIYENDRIHCSIFGFRRANDVLPLHDHPDMYGFIRAIRGQIRIDSYSWLNEDTFEVHAEPPVILEGNDVAMVAPHIGNIHEITALSDDAAFFDVLVPGYIDRICEYYRVVKGPNSEGICSVEPVDIAQNFMVAYPGNKIVYI